MLSDDPMSCKCTSSRCSIRASKCERDAVFERWFPMVRGSFMAKASYTRPHRRSFLPVIRVRGCIDSLQLRYTATHQNLWPFLSEPWHFMSCHFENLVPYGLDMFRYTYLYICIYNYIIEISLEVELPTIWTDEKQRWEESEKRREEKRRRKKIKEEKVRRKKIQVREKIGKPRARFAVFFQWCVAPEGQKDQKVGLLKRRVRSHLATDERWKIARRCGANHIWKSKCAKHTVFGPLLEVEMSKKCRPFWREAHFEVKVQKTEGHPALSDVQMSFCVAGAGDCAPCQKWAKRESFVAVSTMMAGVGHLKRICKDAFRVAGAVQETRELDVLGDQGISWEGLHFGAWDLQVC